MTIIRKTTQEQEEQYRRYCDALLSRGICPPLNEDGSRKKRCEVTGKEMMEMATAAHQDVLRMMQDDYQRIRFDYLSRSVPAPRSWISRLLLS